MRAKKKAKIQADILREAAQEMYRLPHIQCPHVSRGEANFLINLADELEAEHG